MVFDFSPRNVERFRTKDLPECTQQKFAKDGIVPGNVEPVVGDPVFCWQYDS